MCSSVTREINDDDDDVKVHVRVRAHTRYMSVS